MKAVAKPRRPVVLTVDVEEVAVSVEVTVEVTVEMAAVVVRESVHVGVDVDVEGPLGHLVLFVSFFFTCVKHSHSLPGTLVSRKPPKQR